MRTFREWAIDLLSVLPVVILAALLAWVLKR